jgi:hypothetical protein
MQFKGSKFLHVLSDIFRQLSGKTQRWTVVHPAVRKQKKNEMDETRFFAVLKAKNNYTLGHTRV